MLRIELRIDEVLDCIREMAPEELAEPWDNCGLIVDPGRGSAERAVVCLDVTGAAVSEAVRIGAGLIVCHHPLIFNPVKKITRSRAPGSLLFELIKNDIAVYAAHTNVDKTYGGLNDLLAGIVGLDAARSGAGPAPADEHAGAGQAPTDEHAGAAADAIRRTGAQAPAQPHARLENYRVGTLPAPLCAGEFFKYVRNRLKLDALAVSYPQPRAAADRPVQKVLVMCGAYDIKPEAIDALEPDAVVCGEIRHHEALELTDRGVFVARAGHHETERFFVSLIEKWIKEKHPGADVRGFGFSDAPFSYI